jgi:hypothetical protein
MKKSYSAWRVIYYRNGTIIDECIIGDAPLKERFELAHHLKRKLGLPDDVGVSIELTTWEDLRTLN